MKINYNIFSRWCPLNCNRFAIDVFALIMFSWRADLFIHCLPKNVYYRWITSDYSCNWNRTANTTTQGSKRGWKSSQGKFCECIFATETPLGRELWNSARATEKTTQRKTTTGNRGAEEHRLAQRRQCRQQETEERLQRPQKCTETGTKYRNYNAKETDEEREQRLQTLPENAANGIGGGGGGGWGNFRAA